MPPSTARNYVIGRTGSFNAATLDDVDRFLRALRIDLQTADPTRAARVRDDIDKLLERRMELEHK